ncbi:hypothetical protein [Methylophaga sp. OBS4]|uniref:hypothetical protein n=1 Tax=Methylophaga sp. OBS4 TaxID=2991935 RepID=UPI0022515683|nr:hypothetical protein [Methylophaga sp. OBS4]MCX4187192.1 hypothetical protein [Methylophaga sp. OBS4]
MKQEKPAQPHYEQCGFRHSKEVKALINELAQAESLDFTSVMRQLVNAGLQSKYRVQIVGNRVVDRGSIPRLNKVSRAS